MSEGYAVTLGDMFRSLKLPPPPIAGSSMPHMVLVDDPGVEPDPAKRQEWFEKNLGHRLKAAKADDSIESLLLRHPQTNYQSPFAVGVQRALREAMR